MNEDGTPAKSDPVTAACLGKGDPAKVLPNYQGLVFNEAQAGYLAGVLAGQLTKSNTLGTVGGIQTIPPIPQYMGGFQNGALSVNPNVKVLSDFVSTDIAKAFIDPVRGKAIADQMVSQGADVLFQVAGVSGQGVLQAACDNKTCWHRRRRRPVPVGAPLPEVPSDERREEARRQHRIGGDPRRIVDETAVGGNVFLATHPPPGIGLAPSTTPGTIEGHPRRCRPRSTRRSRPSRAVSIKTACKGLRASASRSTAKDKSRFRSDRR